MILKNNTNPIPHLQPMACIDTLMRRSCGPKDQGFIKEVEILYLCLILLIYHFLKITN